jgi:hypothetical protein
LATKVKWFSAETGKTSRSCALERSFRPKSSATASTASVLSDAVVAL